MMCGMCSALFDELGLLLFVHGAMYVSFAALEQPQSVRAVGLHQTVGDCNDTTAVHTPLGQVCVVLSTCFGFQTFLPLATFSSCVRMPFPLPEIDAEDSKRVGCYGMGLRIIHN